MVHVVLVQGYSVASSTLLVVCQCSVLIGIDLAAYTQAGSGVLLCQALAQAMRNGLGLALLKGANMVTSAMVWQQVLQPIKQTAVPQLGMVCSKHWPMDGCEPLVLAAIYGYLQLE